MRPLTISQRSCGKQLFRRVSENFRIFWEKTEAFNHFKFVYDGLQHRCVPGNFPILSERKSMKTLKAVASAFLALNTLLFQMWYAARAKYKVLSRSLFNPLSFFVYSGSGANLGQLRTFDSANKKKKMLVKG